MRDIVAHDTHLVCLFRTLCTTGNTITVEPLPSIRDIANLLGNSTLKDSILIAKTDTLYFDDIDPEVDIDDDVSV